MFCQTMSGGFVVGRCPVQHASLRHFCIDCINLLFDGDLYREPQIIQPILQPCTQPPMPGRNCSGNGLKQLLYRGQIESQYKHQGDSAVYSEDSSSTS